MSNPTYTSLAAERSCDAISELVLGLRWTWNHSTDDLWRELEPKLWKTTQNPWLTLQWETVGASMLAELAIQQARVFVDQ